MVGHLSHEVFIRDGFLLIARHSEMNFTINPIELMTLIKNFTSVLFLRVREERYIEVFIGRVEEIDIVWRLLEK